MHSLPADIPQAETKDLPRKRKKSRSFSATVLTAVLLPGPYLQGRDNAEVSKSSGFFRNEDRTSVIIAAVRARSMLKLLFVAVRALGRCRNGCFVMRTALSAARF